MGYSLACGDVMPGCDARFHADSEQQLLEQAATHAADVHGLTELTPEVVDQVRGAVRRD